MNNSPALRVLSLAGAVLLALAAGARAETPRPPRGAPGERSLVVVNTSDRPINEIYASPTDADAWGEDRLQDATLEPGASVRLRLGRTRECGFDVQIIFEDATREDHLGLDVCRTRTLAVDGRAAAPLPGLHGGEHTVTLVNGGTQPIRQVYISPAYAEQWGDDMLPGQLAEGDSAQVAYHGDCAADLRVVFANRAAEERRGLDLCTTPALLIRPGWTTEDHVPVPGKAAAP